MKLTMIRNLKGNEILSKNILSDNGTILLNKGTLLNREYISKLKDMGVFFVYVEAENLEDVCEDKVLLQLKETSVKDIPDFFDNMINCNHSDVKSLNSVNNMIDYIIGQKNINLNLYEVSTFDDYTYIHCVDTCIMSVFLGTTLNLNNDQIKELGIASILHDIGKLKVPNEIINKRGSLTDEEYSIIKKHPIYGYDILKQYGSFSKSIMFGLLQHHERFDGNGYPFGISGRNISLYSRIISVCDVFTAVSANRSYRKRFDPNEAYELILSGSGTMFDPDIIIDFKNTFAVYPLGCNVMLSDGVEGFVIKQNKCFPDRPIIRVTYNSLTKEKIAPYEINLIENTSVTIISVL